MIKNPQSKDMITKWNILNPIEGAGMNAPSIGLSTSKMLFNASFVFESKSDIYTIYWKKIVISSSLTIKNRHWCILINWSQLVRRKTYESSLK
jgi:hypothetical protein